ncbi:hypothetical protein [Bacillus sp. MRMR6]|uniref:hypothetical protein n=1 Tax=Bacillus sp. MRMR6 TaxID=1928617 RepID=UPI0009534193|nr:hypothetical protein [Bacillus sp. MRMR6]OLS41519.1 hypothetical protein BTR25_02915 [Bacillus sp. MRMR6]
MNQENNEQGYALISVLLIVTVFSVVFLSFIGQAFSSVKQNEVVEQRTRTVAAAEMGISYFQVEIQRMFESKQSIVNSHVSTVMAAAGASTTKDFKREATIKMAQELQSMLPTTTVTPPIKIDEHPNAEFFIKDFVSVANPAADSYKININFNVIGRENGKQTTLDTKMVIDLDTIVNLPTTENPNYYQLPTYNNILKPRVNECTTLTGCDNKVYINGPGSFTGNNLLNDNLTIYTNGSLTLTGTGNENNNSNIKIHAEGDLILGKNMNSQTNLTIETNGNATFNQNLKIDTDSTLLVRRNLTTAQQFDISSRSFAYVGENATVNFLNISSNSKMCVFGDLTYSNSITVPTNNNPKRLIVRGKVLKSGNTTTLTADQKYQVTHNEFVQQCGTYVPPSFQINWGDRISPVISDVEY